VGYSKAGDLRLWGVQASTGPELQGPAVDKGSALLSMDEQEEAFIDTSTSNGNSPGKTLFRVRREMHAPHDTLYR